MTCPHCQDKGLIKIQYQSGEPYDVAICTCPRARVYRQAGEPFIRRTRAIGDEHRIAGLEDFEDGVTPVQAPSESFTAAGKVGKRPRL